jgi:antitoxin (DNA-binding transcriptional repressor) of toxin-antitoxin stability system
MAVNHLYSSTFCEKEMWATSLRCEQQCAHCMAQVAKEVPASKAQVQLSELLTRVQCGEEFVITKRGKAMARMVAEPAQPTTDEKAGIPFDQDDFQEFEVIRTVGLAIPKENS